MIGIYKITNPKGRIYIGQSWDIEKRWGVYKRLDCKKQTKLYRSLIKHGIDKHKFEVLIECDKNQLDDLEKYYIELYQSFNSEYGLNLREGGNKTSFSKETRERMRDAQLGMKHSPERNEKKRIRMLNTKFPKEMYEKAHATRRKNGFKHSEETKKNQSILMKEKYGHLISGWMKNARSKVTPEMLKKNADENWSKPVINLETGIFYNSISDAAKAADWSISWFARLLRKENNKIPFRLV